MTGVTRCDRLFHLFLLTNVLLGTRRRENGATHARETRAPNFKIRPHLVVGRARVLTRVSFSLWALLAADNILGVSCIHPICHWMSNRVEVSFLFVFWDDHPPGSDIWPFTRLSFFLVSEEMRSSILLTLFSSLQNYSAPRTVNKSPKWFYTFYQK